MNVITVNILLRGSSPAAPAARTAWEGFPIYLTTWVIVYRGRAVQYLPPVSETRKTRPPLHGHIFVSLNPH